MRIHINDEIRKRIQLAAFVVLSIMANILLYFAMYKTRMPFFLDTVGTILVTLVAGPYFGIMTAVFTNFFSMFFNTETIYYSAINALIAVVTYWFARRYSLKKITLIVRYVFILATLTGVLSTIIHLLLGDLDSTVIGRQAISISETTGIPYLLLELIFNITVNIVDKAITAAGAILIVRIIPNKAIHRLRTITFKQNWDELDSYDALEKSRTDSKRSDIKRSVRSRETYSLLVTSVTIVVAMSWIGLTLYYNSSKQSSIDNAYDAAIFAADMINPDMIDEYIEKGYDAPGYTMVEEFLMQVRDNAPDVDYLYVTKIEEDGFYMVFNPYKKNENRRVEPGELLPYLDYFKPYISALMAGEEIEPIEYPQDGKRVMSIAYPVRNDIGDTVCYVNCDISLDYIRAYITNFVIRVLLIMAGLLIMLIAYELWLTSIYTTYPIASMTKCMDQFAERGDDQSVLDENVKIIRSLNIRTGDEIEKLYQTLCDMTLNQAEQMRNIRRLTESTMKMQDGLILTMADMVESRDSDTGAHVQKTAAYVSIIVEGLKKKGYYPEKITPKFISDVVRSAPLHDVGKINISDKILNKNGKLTAEEFEIMKTHTTAGKEIIEKAINTVKGGSYLKEARNMAGYHHERWDGKGYPEGLHGEAIPLSARIMAVADVFDALTSKRVYKPALPLEEAVDILKDGAGSQFDPKCVEVFLDSMPEVMVILHKYNQ
ncbi:HD domain-containing phosphohydrolase [Butyrivibrio sp. JL13D10]|uniref:HD domain-containing phosphohydrolase n=1 Tax=Butyrivibrio sp. JL13D10 TaxID=3236815 RepID=UPI0038B42831